MTRIVPTLLLLVALALPASASAIVGGAPATQDYPHMALFVYDGDDDGDDGDFGLRCGASLVRPDWILTAAHCVRDDRDGDGEEETVPPAKVRFVVGARKRSEAASGETLQAAEIIVHPRYQDPAYASHDVALVRLASSSAKGTPIRVSVPSERPLWAPGVMSRVIGWGGLFYPGISGVNTPDELHEVDVPVVDDARCSLVYPSDWLIGRFEAQTLICAGYDHGTKDACSGDSGGPLMVTDAGGAFVQMGVVSWGGACAVPAQYGVYARVADTELRGWLDGTLPAEGTAPAPVAREPLPPPDADAPPQLPDRPAGSEQPSSQSQPPSGRRAVRARITRNVLPRRRLRLGCRLDGAQLRRCRVAVHVRRGGRLVRLRRVTMRAGRTRVVRTGRARRIVLRGVLVARDGQRHRAKRTLRRTR